MRYADGVLAERAGDRVLLLDVEGRELITLNPVGSAVWTFLEEDHGVEEVVNHLAAIFPDVPRERLHADVAAFVEELDEIGLITGVGD